MKISRIDVFQLDIPMASGAAHQGSDDYRSSPVLSLPGRAHCAPNASLVP